jgi:glycosyltransferase involved in cell wall biosynthesis
MAKLPDIASKVRSLCVTGLKAYFKRKVILDYDEFVQSGSGKRALVSYLVHPLSVPPAFREQKQFSNKGIAQAICRSLNELGYTVDIVDFQNDTWLPSRQYQLFIGHGGINFQRIAEKLSKDTVSIYFATGVYWREFNLKEANRFYHLTLRRGVILPADRYTSPGEEIANRLSDGIICLGNENAAASYAGFPRVRNINNAAYPLQTTPAAGKSEQAGKHFLFFSGRGNVHKGLDLLLECFAGTDLHLHVCQHLEEDFSRVYADELNNHPNIHNEGFVTMRSAEFERLASICSWVILPSCAEGQPGSVLECMSYGLVPILSKECNIDLEDWGLTIPQLDPESLSSVIEAASGLSAEDCRLRSAKAREAVQKHYTPDSFRANFKKSVQDIVASCRVQAA